MVVNRARMRSEAPSPLPQRGGGNGHIQLNKSLSSSSTTRRLARTRATIMLIIVFIAAAGSIYLSYGIVIKNLKQQEELQRDAVAAVSVQHPKIPAAMDSQNQVSNSAAIQINHDKCAFRSYPSNRLYGLFSKSQPDFLSDAAYIRGQLPILLNPKESDNKISTVGNTIQQTPPVKVCLDTTSWENLVDKDGKERLPFTDGQNPSVISLAPNPYSVPHSNNQHVRLDPKHLEPLASVFTSVSLDSLFLGVSIFGGGQCKFGLSPEEVDAYRFSRYDEPQGGKRAVISVLAPPNHESPFRTLAQSTLLLERDAKYGTRRRKAIDPEKTESGFARMHQEFDDPRLFFHLGRVWILYRNGPLFGYEDQVHNPIHFERVSPSSEDAARGVKFVAYVKASETVWLSGGRNIALISEEPIVRNGLGEVEWVSSPSLKALTWVDPVSVIESIDLRGVDASIVPPEYHPTPQHRRLGSKPNKSHVHGTNGYMVPLASTGELLGIAHFHRPENRKESDFALHGHHYTHAFFTIARKAGENTGTINSRSFELKRISNEFVFRTNSLPVDVAQQPLDGDIIQFASGLDVVGSDVDGQLIISYGINDCEGAVFTLPMHKVQRILIGVSSGQEVVDLMENVKR